MARIPLVERAFGQDRLARWHRWTGFTSFWLMVAHIVLITARLRRRRARQRVRRAVGHDLDLPRACCWPPPARSRWSWSWSPRSGRPGAGCATSRGTCCTCTRTSGVGLALPHQLWTGTDFIGSTASHGCTGGRCTRCRAGRGPGVPDRPAGLAQPAAPAGGRAAWSPEGPGLTSVYLTGRRLDRLPVRAGQFFQWRFLDGPGWSRSHPYSLSATPHGRLLRITVKDLGDGSARVAAAAARHPGADRGPVRQADRRDVRRRPGRPAGLRHRRHPAAGAARRAAVRGRARRP